jgi:peptidoglycan hydrolase-like protein with peptidoglycan-binding domain
MGKLLASLLSIVVQLYLIEGVFADEQIRRVQEELRKRHLYYGNVTGEITPALTMSIAHYQEKKGFARTGRLDYETCASLGILKIGPQPGPTPFVVTATGEFRGTNGEALPTSVSLPTGTDDRGPPFNSAVINRDRVTLSLAETGSRRAQASRVPPKRTATAHLRRVKPRKETNPFVLTFRTVDHAVKRLFGDGKKKQKPRNNSRFERPSKLRVSSASTAQPPFTDVADTFSLLNS